MFLIPRSKVGFVQTAKIKELKRKNDIQKSSLENMSQHLDFNYSKNLSMEIDALQEEAILYIKEFFDNLRSNFKEYCQQVTEQLILSDEFKKIYQRILEDKKVLDDIDRDVSTFPKHFVLKENFDRYVTKFEQTHDKYLQFTQNRLLPEVSLFRNEEVFKKMKALLKDDIHFKNNMTEFRQNLLTAPSSQDQVLQGGGLPGVSLITPPLSGSEGYEIDFLHYFQENSKILHVMRLARNSLQWEEILLDISFNLPLFFRSVAARADCLLLAGGVDLATGKTSAEVFVLNQPSRTLLKTGEMIEPRNSFGLARLNHRVFAVGGCNDSHGKLNTCESVRSPNEDIAAGKPQQSRRAVDQSGLAQVSLLEPLSHSFSEQVHNQVRRPV